MMNEGLILEANDWCNGRTTVWGFYSRFGFEKEGEEFDLPGLGLADKPAGHDYSWTGLGRFCAEAVDRGSNADDGLTWTALVLDNPVGHALADPKIRYSIWLRVHPGTTRVRTNDSGRRLPCRER